MGERDSLTVFRVGGVPVRIHFTWLFIAAWLAVIIAGQFTSLARVAEVRDTSLLLPPWLWGVLLMLSLFGCVLLHELAHVVVARRAGARVRGITLMMLGGVSEIEGIERPDVELRSSLAGPLLSLLLALCFYGLFRGLRPAAPPDVNFGLFYLAQVNLVIGLFNLLPAFPMDGGRVLRSLLRPRHGLLRATRIAAVVGRVVAVGLIVLGVLTLGFWLALVGVFLLVTGGMEQRGLELREALRGLRVRDVLPVATVEVPHDESVAAAAATMVRAGVDAAVVLREGRPLGVVTAAGVASVPVDDRTSTPLERVLQHTPSVSPNDDLGAALRMMEEQRLGAVPVVDAERSVVVGVLSPSTVSRGLQLHAQPGTLVPQT